MFVPSRRSAPWLLTGVAVVLAAGPARAERFAYRYRLGQAISTQAKLAGASMMGQRGGTMGKMRFRLTALQTLRVVFVGSGTVTLEVTDTPQNGQMTAMGRTESYPRTPTRYLVRMTERGKFLSRKNLGGGSTGATAGEDAATGDTATEAADAFFGLSFPDRDLKPGDTWEDTITVGGPSQPRTVHLRSRYVGRETFRGRACAKFTSVATMSATETSETPLSGAVSEGEGGVSTQGRMTAALTTYFDPVAGLELYQRATLTVVAKTDLTGISPNAGEFVSVSRINSVQGQISARRRK